MHETDHSRQLSSLLSTRILSGVDMTTVRTTMADVKKLSFAKVRPGQGPPHRSVVSLLTLTHKVVASTTPETPTSTPRDSIPNAGRESLLPSVSIKSDLIMAGNSMGLNGAPIAMGTLRATDGVTSTREDHLVDGLGKLKIQQKAPSLVVNGTSSTSTGTSSKVQTPSDDISQKGDSSSDLGTKPPSIDGKSITSGTTFNALDEKESLRPDDSASVQAAAEDDDAFSIRGSLIAGSRMGSEVAARVHRIQLGDMPPRSISHQHVIVESGTQGVVTLQNASSEQLPVTDAKIALVGATSTPSGIYGQNPDEKLLEAMQSQKDRLFLLKLEEMVIEFVQDSK